MLERAVAETKREKRAGEGGHGRVACALLTLMLATASPSAAQQKGPGNAALTQPKAAAGAPVKPGKASKPPKLDVVATAARLAQTDTLPGALADVAAAGAAATKLAPRIGELLGSGLPVDLAVAAMNALGAIGSPASSAAIAPYLQHRNAEVRRAAAQALGRTGGPDARAALLRGLRASDAVVRGLSASGLRFAGDRDSVPDLVRALDRHVTEAAAAIAALCEGPACDDLTARFDKLAPGVQNAALEMMLKRKPALPDDVVLLALSKTSALSAASAQAWLASLEAGKSGSKKVKKALEEAIRAAKEASP